MVETKHQNQCRKYFFQQETLWCVFFVYIICLKKLSFCVSASVRSGPKMKTVHLLYLPAGLPADVHKLIPKKLKEVQKCEHPLLMQTLENMRDCEKDFFNMDKLFSCVLAFLYVEARKESFDMELKQKAQVLLDDVLQEEPENLIALCLKEEVNRSRSKEKLKSALGSKLQMNNAFVVIAFYLYKLNMIHAAIALFDQAISVWEQNGKGQEFKVVLWKYLLAGAYIKLLNKYMFSQDKLFDPDETMIRIKELLSSGMDFGKDHTVLAARCYTDLALAFSKYQLIGRPEDRRVSIDLTPEECYEEAWKLCDGNDPHVMEKYAMFIRKMATTTQSLLDAAKIFEKLLRQCPHRHVAAHQLALTYKYLWFDEEKLEQRYLYQNKVKAGKVFKVPYVSRNQRRRQRRARNVQEQKQIAPLVERRMDENIVCDRTSSADNDGAVGGEDTITEETANTAKNDATVCGQDVVIEETADSRPDYQGAIVKDQMDSSPLDLRREVHVDTDNPNQPQDTDLHTINPDHDHNISADEVTDAMKQLTCSSTSSMVEKEPEKSKRGRNSKLHTSDEPIHPTWPQDYNKVPHHMNKKPDYYDRLRAENPIARKSNPRYLGLAKYYLEQANQSAKNLRALYLVDLARVNISLGDSDSANAASRLFDNARNALSASCGRTSHRDIAYLYEQWAMMLANEYDELDSVSSSDSTDIEETFVSLDRLNRIESYFLKSIRSAIRIKSKSRVAYYRLTEMLEKPEARHKWKVLYEVYKLVGQNEKAAALLKGKDTQDPELREPLTQECCQTDSYGKYLELAHSIRSKLGIADSSLQVDIVEMAVLQNRSTPDSSCGEETVLLKMYADYGEAMKVSLKRQISEESDAGAYGVQPQRKKRKLPHPDDDVTEEAAGTDAMKQPTNFPLANQGRFHVTILDMFQSLSQVSEGNDDEDLPQFNEEL